MTLLSNIETFSIKKIMVHLFFVFFVLEIMNSLLFFFTMTLLSNVETKNPVYITVFEIKFNTDQFLSVYASQSMILYKKLF